MYHYYKMSGTILIVYMVDSIYFVTPIPEIAIPEILAYVRCLV